MFKFIGAIGFELLIIGVIPHPESGSGLLIIIGAALVGCVLGAIADGLNTIGD